MPAHEHEELRSNPEFIKGDLRHQRESAPGGVSLPECVFIGENLDEALVPEPDAKPSRPGIGLGPIKGCGGDDGVVDVAEGVEGDAVL